MSASSWFPPKALSLTGQQAWGSCWLKASRAGCSVSPWDSERKEWWMFLTEKVDDRQTEICCTAFTWSYLHFTGLSVRVVLSYNMIQSVGRLPRWLTGYRIHLQCRRHRQRRVQSPGREDSLEEGRQPTPVSLPGESHERRSLMGYSPQGRRIGHNWSDWACTHAPSLVSSQWQELCLFSFHILSLQVFHRWVNAHWFIWSIHTPPSPSEQVLFLFCAGTFSQHGFSSPICQQRSV